MCRLFGLIANRPVNIMYSFFDKTSRSIINQAKMDQLGRSNQDGWGVGFYNDQLKAQIQKMGKWSVDKDRSKLFNIIGRIRSNIIISHIRLASVGQKTNENAHPYKFHINNHDYIFAHNGGIDMFHLLDYLDEDIRPPNYEKTDSAAYFRLIMQELKDNKYNFIKGIKAAIEIVKERNYTGLNFILSDGVNLYAYRDYNNDSGNKYTLYHLFRDPQKDSNMYGFSKETNQRIEFKDIDQKATLIASEKITGNMENWIPLKRGELLIARKSTSIEKVSKCIDCSSIMLF